jgi:hypothetical protein
MLRRHRVDQRPVTEVATAFGISRQAFYAAETAFTAGGLPGLLPRPRGPKGAHKCTDEILDFLEQHRAAAPAHSAADWAAVVRERFGIAIHPRSLARALARRKKTAPSGGPGGVSPVGADAQYSTDQYEALRREALEVAPFGPRGHGLALFLARGLPAWLTALTALAPSPLPRVVDEQRPLLAPRLRPDTRGALTMVLAGMVLVCAQPQEDP